MSLFKSAIQDAFKSKGKELEALAWIKLVLELHPVCKKRIKESESTSFKRRTWVLHNSTETMRPMTHGLHSTATHLHLLMSGPVLGPKPKLPFWEMARLYFLKGQCYYNSALTFSLRSHKYLPFRSLEWVRKGFFFFFFFLSINWIF